MAVSDFEQQQWKRYLEEFLGRRRPPVHLRSKVDLGYRIEKQSVEIFEIRPNIDDPCKFHEVPVAKTRYFKSREEWRICWMRAEGKWHICDPVPDVGTLNDFSYLVEEDEYSFFYG